MSIWIFVVVVFLEDGKSQISVRQVPACPPDEVVVKVGEDMIKRGVIEDWTALCQEIPVIPTYKM